MSDRTADDLVAGRPVAGEADLVAALRLVAACAHVAPPTPSTALEALLLGVGAPGVAGVPLAVGPARWAAARRWVTGGGVGISAALLALTGAAAAQALPAPLQQAVSGAVRVLTPFELPAGDEQPRRLDGPAPVVPGAEPADGQDRGDGRVTEAPSPDGDDETDARDDSDDRGDGGAVDGSTDQGEDDAPDAPDDGVDDGDGRAELDRPDDQDSTGTDLDPAGDGSAVSPTEDEPGGPDDAGTVGPAEDDGPTGPDDLGTEDPADGDGDGGPAAEDASAEDAAAGDPAAVDAGAHDLREDIGDADREVSQDPVG